MLKIKLAPTGKKHQRLFRIVVTEEHSKITGSVTEYLGHFNPKTKEVVCDAAKLKHWISCGAQPTNRVRGLLKL